MLCVVRFRVIYFFVFLSMEHYIYKKSIVFYYYLIRILTMHILDSPNICYLEIINVIVYIFIIKGK